MGPHPLHNGSRQISPADDVFLLPPGRTCENTELQCVNEHPPTLCVHECMCVCVYVCARVRVCIFNRPRSWEREPVIGL